MFDHEIHRTTKKFLRGKEYDPSKGQNATSATTLREISSRRGV